MGKVKLLINVQNISFAYLKSFVYLNYFTFLCSLTEYSDVTSLVPYVPINSKKYEQIDSNFNDKF